ncbi:cytochrome c-type biogenesis protein NrfE [Pluralibacter gergoviae]|nr:cytochrome c-type biogenesis protein NrfE [Pluralibacter gergoviae]
MENASLLPWLSATALLHSLPVSARGGSFRHWSLLLAIATLLLSLLGTLIVRSGILVSVHAFALDNVRAVPLFTLFTLLSLAALGLYAWRGRSNGPPAPPAGRRELLTLAALLLFCAVLGVVLIGTLYPMIYGLLGLGPVSYTHLDVYKRQAAVLRRAGRRAHPVSYTHLDVYKRQAAW